MEPPAKRLRILQSVEVDETNPDYIEAKQKQQQRFKGRLESLFAKYEGMHESMSDEIDFRTNKVVVDRGHLRRVQRQMGRKETTLLNSFLETGPAQDDTSEKEDEGGTESEDELAPTQMPKRVTDSIKDPEKAAHSSEQHGAQPTTSPSHTAPVGLVQGNVLQVPNTPNSAANLLQHVQFPQTPLGQQAQAAFYANLNQTIARAVQQAVAPLLSSVFQTTPTAHIPQAPLFSVPSPHIPETDNVRPATDPKWYFPPMAIAKDAQQMEHQRSSPPVIREPAQNHSAHSEISKEKATSSVTQASFTTVSPGIMNKGEASSPLILRRRSPKVEIRRNLDTRKNKCKPTTTSRTRPKGAQYDLVQRRELESSQRQQESVEISPSSQSLPTLNDDTNTSLELNPPIVATSGAKLKTMKGSRPRYHFTQEDDIYISKERELHNLSWPEIKSSKKKWSAWPLSTFYNRWKKHLKGKQLYLLTDTVRVSSSSRTPVEHEDHFFSSKEIPETSSASHHLPTPSSLGQDDNHTERIMIPSSSHFDDDELELLSLAGADVSPEPPTLSYEEDEAAYPTPDDILPSIEGAEFRTEDELQLEMLKTEDSDYEEPLPPPVLPSTIPETQESVVAVSSPAQKSKTNAKPRHILTYRAVSDSDDDIDLVGNDAPATPRIKRESLTPQASKFLCSSPAFKTPGSAPQFAGIVSSGAQSTGKLDRKAYLREVKQSWAKGKTPRQTQKRRSLNVLPTARKRAWAEVGDSEDELAV